MTESNRPQPNYPPPNWPNSLTEPDYGQNQPERFGYHPEQPLQMKPNRHDGLAIAGLCCAIVGLLFGLIPILFFMAWILGVLGLIFGLVGVRTKKGKFAVIIALGAIALGVWGVIDVNSAVNDLNTCFQNAKTCNN